MPMSCINNTGRRVGHAHHPIKDVQAHAAIGTHTYLVRVRPRPITPPIDTPVAIAEIVRQTPELDRPLRTADVDRQRDIPAPAIKRHGRVTVPDNRTRLPEREPTQ